MALAVSVASNTASSASVTVSQPAGGWATGNLLICLFSGNGSGFPTFSSPWSGVSSDTNAHAAVGYQVISGTAPSSYTFTFTGSTSSAAIILEYPASLASGIDVSSANGARATTITWTAITNTNPNEVVVAFAAIQGGAQSATTPTGYSLETSQAGGNQLYAWDKQQAASGTTGSPTSTITRNIYSAFLVSLLPSVGNSASATDSIEILTAVGSAGQSNQASAANSLEVLSVAGSISDWALGSASLLPLTAVGAASNQAADNATSADSVLVLSASGSAQQSDQASASLTIEALAIVSSLGQSDQAHGLATIEVLSSVASISDWATAQASFLQISATASASQSDQAHGLASFFILSDVASISDWAYSQATIPALTASGQAGQVDQASSAAGLLSISAVGQASQSDVAHGLATIPPITGGGTISLWSYGRATLASLTCTSQVSQFDAAYLRGDNPWSPGFGPGFGQNGSVILGLSAVGGLAQGNAVNGLATVQLAAIGSLGQSDQAHGTVTLESLSAVGSVSDAAYGSSTLGNLACAGQASQYDQASSATTLLWSASGVASLSTNAAGLATFLPLSAAGQIGQNDLASGAATVLPLSCVATIPDWCFSQNSVLGLSAFGFAGQGSVAFSRSTFFPLSCIATGQIPVGAIGAATVLSLSSVGQLAQHDPATGSASINLSASGSISDWAYGRASIVFGAAGNAAQGVVCSGSATFTFAASGHAGQEDRASAAASILALGVVGSQASSTLASASPPFMGLSAAGEAALQLPATGSGAIAFSAAGIAEQSNQASASVSWELASFGNIGLAQLASCAADIDFVGAGALSQGSGEACFGLAILSTLSARGEIRFYEQGPARGVWFGIDDRTVSWPPWAGEVIVPRDDALVTANRAVWWGR